MGYIVLNILGEDEPEEKKPETPKEPETVTSPRTRHDTRLLKQVINIHGEIVTQ